MIKLENPPPLRKPFTVGDMKPLQVGILDSGEVVMRTAREAKFEVMSLSDPGLNRCWTSCNCSLNVTLITEPLTLTLLPDNYDSI